VQVLSLAVAVRALALGIFPPAAAPSAAIHVVLGALFAVALARTRAPAPAGAAAQR
jgi:tellurite resistance protein TehA-like permease